MKHKHGLCMLLYCLAMPIVLLALVHTSGWGAEWLAFLVCPLMHLVMLVGLFGGRNKHCHSGTDNDKASPE